MRKNRSVAKVTQIYESCNGDQQKRIRELKRCVREGHKTGDIAMMGSAFCYLADVSYALDDPPGMLANALKAITLLLDTKEYEMIAKSYSALGHAYTNLGNNQLSLVCDETAHEIVRKHRIKGKTRIAVLNNLSVSYHMMGDAKRSIRCLNECIELVKKDYSDDITDLFMYSINLAECHKDNGEPERALEILLSIASLVDKVDYQPIVCDYYLRIAIISYLLGHVTAGNDYVDTAFSIFPENVYPIPLYDDLWKVARFLSKSGDHPRAKKILDLMTVYAEKNIGTMEQLFVKRMMADYYKNFGDYKRASEYYAAYEELNEKQLMEQKEMQLKQHDTTRNAEMEVRRLKEKMRENEELASREPLTKLLNRSALLQVSAGFIESAAKKKQKVGGIFMDIDFFKECNDTYGHAKGDEIIREVARICRKQETPNVRFARYGGDEFFGITLGLTDEEVCNVARKICQAVRNADIPHVKNPNGGRLTLSVGVVNVTITDRTDTILEIANYADKAVYHAKNAGKNAIYQLVHSEAGTKDSSSSFIRIDF